jgi:hypothetical protein
MVRKGRDPVFANLIRSGEQRVARERAAAVAQPPPAGQDAFAPSAQHFVRNQGAPPRPDLLDLLLSVQRQGYGQEAPRDEGAQPRSKALRPLLATQQVCPRDQTERVARLIEARIQEQNDEAQQVDQGQAQGLANRPQGVQSNQQALSQQQHRFSVQEAALRHHENQINHIANVSTPIPTRAQAEHIFRHQRIRFTQVSRRTPEGLRICRLVLQNIASLWQVLSVIEVIPAVILPKHAHVPVNLRGLVDPTDLRTWDGRILDGLYALAELTPGRPESVTTLLQQSVRRRRDQGLGHDCLTLWDVEHLLRDIQSRQREGAGGTGDGENSQASPSQTTPSCSDDEGDDNDQGGTGATHGNQQNHLNNDAAAANGHADFVAPVGGYGLNSLSNTSSDSDINNGTDNNGTQDAETNHSSSINAPSSRPRTRSQTSARSSHSNLHRCLSLDSVVEARACSQRKQQDRLHVQYMLRLRANRPSLYNSDVSSKSTPSSSGLEIDPDGLPVRDANEENDGMHVDTDEEVENGEEESSRPPTRSQTSAASNRSSHSDLYRDPSPETVAAARAIRLVNTNPNVNAAQNVENDDDTTLVNVGGTTIGSTTLVDDGEIDDLRSTSATASTPSGNGRPRPTGLYNRFIDRIYRVGGSRARQHDVIPPPWNVDFRPTGGQNADSDVDSTTEVAGEDDSSRTLSAPSNIRPRTRSQTSAASHQSSISNSDEAAREAEEQRLTDAHEAARHAFETRHAREGRVPLIDQMMDGYLGATPSQDEETDCAESDEEAVVHGEDGEAARENEEFSRYVAETTPPHQSVTEALNEQKSPASRKRRRTRSWGSRTFKPSPSKKRNTQSPKSPTPPSRASTPPQPSRRISSLLLSAPGSPAPSTSSSSSSRSLETEVDIPLHIVYDQMMEAGRKRAVEDAEHKDTQHGAGDDDDVHIDTDGEEIVEGDENEGEKTPSSSSSSFSASSSSSSSSGNGNGNGKPIPETSPPVEPDSNDVHEQTWQSRNDPKAPETPRHMTSAEYEELGAIFDDEQTNLQSEGVNLPNDNENNGNDDGDNDESFPESIIHTDHSSDLKPSDSSDNEDFFSTTSSSSSSYDDESDSIGSVPSNVTDSDHESYDFTPSPSPSAQSQDQDAYDETQANADAFHQFMQEQYGEGIANFFQNIDREDGRERPETRDEADALGDFYQAQGVRSSPIEEYTEPRSASTSSSIRILNNAYDNARRTSIADARMRELSGRPQTGSGNLDYDGTRPGSGSSQTRRSDGLRSVSGSSRVTRSSTSSEGSSVHAGDMYMGRRITSVIRLRPGEYILVKVVRKE